MKKENKKQALREMKALSLSLYEFYLAQASEKITEMNSYHENGHDNSGGHPDYHCNQHDNTPSRMMRLVLTKDVTN
jgi:hypothetical protein